MDHGVYCSCGNGSLLPLNKSSRVYLGVRQCMIIICLHFFSPFLICMVSHHMVFIWTKKVLLNLIWPQIRNSYYEVWQIKLKKDTTTCTRSLGQERRPCLLKTGLSIYSSHQSRKQRIFDIKDHLLQWIAKKDHFSNSIEQVVLCVKNSKQQPKLARKRSMDEWIQWHGRRFNSTEKSPISRGKKFRVLLSNITHQQQIFNVKCSLDSGWHWRKWV
jgi:hypothetical protein